MIKALALLCVIGIACGQLLFKIVADAMQQHGTFHPTPIIILLGALFLYGLTTLLWVWVLKNSELGKIYPLMALAFVLVPAGSHFLLGEQFSNRYYIGIACIVAGIILTSSNS